MKAIVLLLFRFQRHRGAWAWRVNLEDKSTRLFGPLSSKRDKDAAEAAALYRSAGYMLRKNSTIVGIKASQPKRKPRSYM
jgi:hypothetical protein